MRVLEATRIGSVESSPSVGEFFESALLERSSLNLADTLLLGDAVTRDCYSMTVSQQDLIPPFRHSHTYPREPLLQLFPPIFLRKTSLKSPRELYLMHSELSIRSIISIYTEKSSIARDTSEVSANRSASQPASHSFQILAPKELYYLTLLYLTSSRLLNISKSKSKLFSISISISTSSF